MLLLITSATFIILLHLLYHGRNIYLTWKYPKAQSFFYVPILGHIGILKYVNPSMKSFMEFYDLLAEDSGKLVNVLGNKTILTYKADHMAVILTHPNTQRKHYVYDFFAAFVGDSIFRIGGVEWKQQRKAMISTMHPNVIAPYTNDMQTCAEILADKWQKKIGITFDIKSDIAMCLLEMFIKAAFDVKVNVQHEDTPIDKHAETYLELTMYRVISLVKHPDFLYKWTNDYKVQQNALKHVQDFSSKIFNIKKTIYEQEQLKTKHDVLVDDLKPTKKTKFIDHLFDLYSQNKFTMQQVHDEVNTFIVAGFETCTSALSFAILSIAMHQDIQENLYQELLDVLGPDRAVEYDDLSKLVYLEKVIKEVLRLFPSAPIVARVAEDEFELNGNIVPKGTQFCLHVLKMHRSSLYWKDPLKFDPERFSRDRFADQTKYSYIPFLAGARTCFGPRVAWITLKASMATLLRRYKFFTPVKTIEDISLSIKMTLKAENGIQVSFESRL